MNRQGHIEAVITMMKRPFYGWRKPEHPEETTDPRQVTEETWKHQAEENDTMTNGKEKRDQYL